MSIDRFFYRNCQELYFITGANLCILPKLQAVLIKTNCLELFKKLCIKKLLEKEVSKDLYLSLLFYDLVSKVAQNCPFIPFKKN